MSQYTTVAKVRECAGFVGNTNISDAFFVGMIRKGQSKVNGYISDVYTLPLVKFYENTIVFSGAGTGAANMTITIDGANYVVAVTNLMTAAQAADAFRTAALDNTSFVTDGIGSGTTVTIDSKLEDDPTTVTITSTDPQTVQGIVATGGTVTEVAAPGVRDITTELAAAYSLIVEYGPEAQDTDKDGFKRLALWKAELKAIQSKEIKLYDYSDVELARATTQRMKFFPNNASEDDEDNPTESRVKMNMKF